MTPQQAGLINEIRKLGQLSEELLNKVSAVPDEGTAPTLRSSAADLIKVLAQTFSSLAVSEEGDQQRTWELIGLLYMFSNRNAEALEVFRRLYDHILKAQDDSNNQNRFSKGMPLVWMSECYAGMGYRATAHRYLMLTLVEDAIKGGGEITFGSGTYPRLVWSGLLSEDELKRYAKKAHELYVSNQLEASYPEWVLQGLDRDWITQAPAPSEAAVFDANRLYLDRLIKRLGDGSGRNLEALANYLLSCMPGCRTAPGRQSSFSTDYDVICSVEGLETDFRSELGRYFVCECKDKSRKPATVTDLAKFCYVLDSIKARFGILFSKRGISGKDGTQYASRERLKVFQNRGIIIVIIDEQDLSHLCNGANFISLLRRKYEEVRLDLSGSARFKPTLGL